MHVPLDERVAAWFVAGESDLRVAETLRDTPAHVACFHAQQGVEKALKAIVTRLSGDAPPIQWMVRILSAIDAFAQPVPPDSDTISRRARLRRCGTRLQAPRRRRGDRERTRRVFVGARMRTYAPLRICAGLAIVRSADPEPFAIVGASDVFSGYERQCAIQKPGDRHVQRSADFFDS